MNGYFVRNPDGMLSLECLNYVSKEELPSCFLTWAEEGLEVGDLVGLFQVELGLWTMKMTSPILHDKWERKNLMAIGGISPGGKTWVIAGPGAVGYYPRQIGPCPCRVDSVSGKWVFEMVA